MSQYEEHVFDAILGRRSIRKYLDKPVEDSKIEKLLQAAMAAPSACNIQPWEFVVVTEKDKVALVKENIPRYGNYNAPVVIVVCGTGKYIPWDNDMGETDCCAAVENMLIAATAMGLGSVWIGGFKKPVIRDLLGIPENVLPVAVTYFGYPAEHKEPRTKYVEQAIHWQHYDAEREQDVRPGNLVYRKP